MKTYNLYKNDYLPCPFCKKNINLYNSKSHIKTKKCNELQTLLKNKNYYDDLYIEFIKTRNELKDEIRFNHNTV
jgi:hypothetical protein